MDTMKLPIGIDKLSIEPNEVVYNCFTGEEIKVEGFCFYDHEPSLISDSWVHSVIYTNDEGNVDYIPAIYCTHKEPDDDEKVHFLRAALKAKIVAKAICDSLE